MSFPNLARGAGVSLIAILWAASALAAPGDDAATRGAMARLSPAFGNTIVSTHPDGRKARLQLDASGAYAAESRAGERSSGTWKVKGEKLCLSQRRPFPIPFPYCKAIPAEQLGKPWRDTAVNGERVTNEIVRGRGTAGRGRRGGDPDFGELAYFFYRLASCER